MRSRHRLVLAFVFTTILLATASAQAQRPALTKSVDEPGRSPYSETASAACSNGAGPCTIQFRVVPAGFRLVVTHVSVNVNTQLNTNAEAILLQDVGYNKEFLPAPAAIAPLEFVISTMVTYYVEPGSTPEIEVHGSAVGNIATASINGYLVAIP